MIKSIAEEREPVDFCITCGKTADWIRTTQFAGKMPYYQEHAKNERDFGVENSYQGWIKLRVDE